MTKKIWLEFPVINRYEEKIDYLCEITYDDDDVKKFASSLSEPMNIDEIEDDDDFLAYLKEVYQDEAQDIYNERHPEPLTAEDYASIEADRRYKIRRDYGNE